MTTSPTPAMLSADDVREMLRRECEAAGSREKWAHKHAMSPALVSFFLAGKQGPGPKIEGALGIRRVWTVDNE
jgi:hypothetical protein